MQSKEAADNHGRVIIVGDSQEKQISMDRWTSAETDNAQLNIAHLQTRESTIDGCIYDFLSGVPRRPTISQTGVHWTFEKSSPGTYPTYIGT